MGKESEACFMSDEQPIGYFFNPKVLVIVVITNIILGLLLILMIRFMRHWRLMPDLFGLIMATVIIAEAYWVNHRRWTPE